jgi:hypothetical protein
MSRKPLFAVAAVLIAVAVLFVSADMAAILSPNAAEMLKPYVAAALAIPATTAAEPLACSIREFCRAHGISVPSYYSLKKQGLGPVEMRMGSLIRISTESAAAWRAARANPGEAEAEASAQTAEAMRARARRAAKRSVASPRHISRRTAEVA